MCLCWIPHIENWDSRRPPMMITPIYILINLLLSHVKSRHNKSYGIFTFRPQKITPTTTKNDRRNIHVYPIDCQLHFQRCNPLRFCLLQYRPTRMDFFREMYHIHFNGEMESTLIDDASVAHNLMLCCCAMCDTHSGSISFGVICCCWFFKSSFASYGYFFLNLIILWREVFAWSDTRSLHQNSRYVVPHVCNIYKRQRESTEEERKGRITVTELTVQWAFFFLIEFD